VSSAGTVGLDRAPAATPALPNARRHLDLAASRHPLSTRSIPDPMTVTGYAKDVLVSADWAKANLDNPDVRFVEVDVDTTAYDQSHIPGAVGWNWTSQLADGVRRDIAGREEFSELLSTSGIGPGTTIVLYGDNNNWFAAWAYWQLKLYGVDDVKLLNGGRKYWLDNGYPLSTDVPSYVPSGWQLPEPDFSLRAYRDDILPRLGDEGLALVDVRSPAEFNGEVIAPPGMTETAQRAGHIPGAASIPWAQQVREDGTFKSAEELTELYRAKGITADRDTIAYCRIGERSSLSWFVLRELLGFQRVRNYDGSWTEWGSMVGVPIEKAQPAAVGA
jgi:thiosulfate/3-mercaptopyruvate sulfurtransferase